MSVPGAFDREGVIKGGDFHHFYVLGTLAREGKGEALYDPVEQSRAAARVVSPALHSWFPRPAHGPHVALLFAPLAVLPFVPALALFLALTICAYLASTWALARSFPSLRDDGALLWILVLANPALWYLIRFGQTSAIALGCLTLAFLALRANSAWLAGAAIGGLFYKPQMGMIFGLVWLMAREWKLVGGAMLSIAAQVAVGWLYFGTSTMLKYVHAAMALIVDRTGAEPIPQHLHSIRGFLSLLVPDGRLETAMFVLASVVLVWAAYRGWTAPSPMPLRFAQMVLISVLASLHLTVYDLVILLPVYLVLIALLVENRWPWGRGELGILLVVLFMSPILGASITYFTRVQLSVPVMVWLAYRLDSLMRPKVMA